MINTNRDVKSFLVLASANPQKTAGLLEKLLSNIDGPLKNIEIIIIPTRIDRKYRLELNSIKEIIKLKKLNIDELIIFNEDDLLAVHLGQFFHNNNILVSLAQDGMKTYAKINKLALRYRFMRTMNYYSYCKANNFRYFPLFVSMEYGKSSYTNKLYVSHLNAFDNRFKKEIEQVELDVNILKLYGHLNDRIFLNKNKQTIFFVSSLLKYDQASLDIETKILKQLNSLALDCQLVIKMHPRASVEVTSYYTQNFNNWVIINDSLPAEIYINEINSCTLLSAFSGVALFNKVGLKKYWLYPLYENSIKSLRYTKLEKPDDSIILVEKWEDLYNIFPNTEALNILI